VVDWLHNKALNFCIGPSKIVRKELERNMKCGARRGPLVAPKIQTCYGTKSTKPPLPVSGAGLLGHHCDVPCLGLWLSGSNVGYFEVSYSSVFHKWHDCNGYVQFGEMLVEKRRVDVSRLGL